MYFKTDEKKIEFNPEQISKAYNQGYVLTRLGKGVVNQTRSLRINLSEFNLNSENRRILKKTEWLEIKFNGLPLEDYSWEIHKLGKDFYSSKFGEHTMSASKIKEMFNEMGESNMNSVFIYKFQNIRNKEQINSKVKNQKSEEGMVNCELEIGNSNVGYCLAYVNEEIVHYAYPFYDLNVAEEIPNLGLGMMIRSIIWAKENNKKYIYLGSVVEKSSKYKLQFKGLEWWDTNNWSADMEKLKSLL